MLMAANGESSAAERLVVRTYIYGGSSGQEMAIARETASGILEEAGFELVWRDCSVGCLDALGRGEVLLRVVVAPASAPPGSLGCSVVDLQHRTGALSTVYADRIAEAANRVGVDTGRLLGRAIAHELGHLLLGTSRHSPGGLMRALWADRELQRDRSSDWTWLPEDLVRLSRAGLAFDAD